MVNEICEIEVLVREVYELIQITKDSCAFNEYFAQESMLTKALQKQELILEKIFELEPVF